MAEAKISYYKALSDFLLSDSEDASLYAIPSLGRQMNGLLPEELSSLHEECMSLLTSNMDSGLAVQCYRRSFVFLTEMMVFCRYSQQAGWSKDEVVEELRQVLRKSYDSFQNVKNKYESVLQHMDSGIVLLDRDGCVTFANLQICHLLGVPRTTLLNKNLKGLLRIRSLPQNIRRLLYRIYLEVINIRSTNYEFVDGNDRHFIITANYGDELLEEGILFSVKDVTEFKRIEQSAYHNDKLAMLGKIAASIAHEIRNPLTSIRGFIQLLHPYLKQLGKDDYAKIILEEIDRANDIIYEFLNSSKPSAPIKEDIQVSSLIQEIALLYKSEALLKGCEMQIKPIDPSISICVDVKQIKQVLLNILKNALEVIAETQSNRRGLIVANAEQTDTSVILSIEDNGKGMDQKTLTKLFDPFFTTKKDGTGLGLSVSYRIIKNHGGSIQVDSTPGEGTVFRILMPRTQAGFIHNDYVPPHKYEIGIEA